MEQIVILPSDSSFTTYPENKIGWYKVDLDPPIDLSEGEGWEVALLDISYPTRWENVLHEEEMSITVHQPGRHICRTGLRPGSYFDASAFVSGLQDGIKSQYFRNHIHLRKPSVTKENQFVLGIYTQTESRREIIFSAPLAKALGVFDFPPLDRGDSLTGSFLLMDNVLPKHVSDEIKSKQSLEEKKDVRRKYNQWFSVPDETGLGFQVRHYPARMHEKFIFPNKVDPNINFRQLTVTTNIVETDPTNRKMLRVFVPDLMTEAAHVVHKEFITPYFKPILKGLELLKTIEIIILDELDRPVRFTRGKASVTLCVRQRR